MIALGIIIAVLLIISLIRLGLIVEYSSDGFYAAAIAGPVRIVLYPAKKKKLKKKSTHEEKAKEEKSEDKTEKKGGSFEKVKKVLPMISSSLKKFKHHLLINNLTVYFKAASDDPYSTAMQFGISSSGMGMIVSVLESNFNIRKRDLRTFVSFEDEKPTVYVKIKMTIAVWEAVYIALGAVKIIMALKDDNKETRERKVDSNG